MNGIDDKQMVSGLPTRLTGAAIDAYHSLTITPQSTFDSVTSELASLLDETHIMTNGRSENNDISMVDTRLHLHMESTAVKQRQRVFSAITLESGNSVKALVDTGAVVSVIAWNIIVREKLPIQQDEDTNFVTITGQPIFIMGSVKINVAWGHMTRQIRFYVQYDPIHHMVIGDDMLRSFGATICYAAPQVAIYIGECHTMTWHTVNIWPQETTNTDIAVIELAPRTKMYVPCILDADLVDEGDQWIWMEPSPNTTKHTQKFVGETLIRTDRYDRAAYIPLANTSNKLVKIDETRILLMGSKVTKTSSLHYTLENLAIRDQEWTNWLTSGIIPDSAYPMGVPVTQTPTDKLTQLWQNIRQYRVTQIPAIYFDIIDWSDTTVTPAQQLAMKTFICQPRHSISKSQADLGVNDVLIHPYATSLHNAINSNIKCDCIVTKCPKRDSPHNAAQLLDIELSKLTHMGLLKKSQTTRVRSIIIIYRNPDSLKQNTHHNLIISTCREWAHQKQWAIPVTTDDNAQPPASLKTEDTTSSDVMDHPEEPQQNPTA